MAKKLKFFGFLGEICQTQTKDCKPDPTQPDLSKKNRPDPTWVKKFYPDPSP